MTSPYKKISEKIIIQDQWLEVKKTKFELINGKIIPSYYFVNNRDVSCVFALTDDNQVICVNQYRVGIDADYLQFITGYIDEGETPLEAAKREMLEEASCVSDEIIYLGKLHANPSRSSYFLHFFLAKNAKQIDYSGPTDETEFLESKLIPLNKINIIDSEYAFADLTSASCWALVKPYLK